MPPVRSRWSGPSWFPSGWPRDPGPQAQAPPDRLRTSTAKSGLNHHSWLMEAITDAADGLDKVGGVAELLPQALDVNVDRSLQDHSVLAYGGVHQLEAGKGTACLPEQ